MLILWMLISLSFAQDYEAGTSPSVIKKRRFAGRFYIKNTLIKVFGKDAEAVIDQNYFKAGKQVGGPCDIYEQVFHDHDKLLDPTRECPGGKPASKFPLFPDTNILRSSHLLKTCYELSYKMDVPKKFESEKYLENLSETFYPYGGDEKLKDILKTESKLTVPDKKRKALLTYCLSPGWQTL